MPRKRIGITLLAVLLAALTVDGSSLPIKSRIATSQALAQNADPRKAEADRLLNQGLQQYNASQFAAALQSWQQALKIYQELKDSSGEADSLNNLGNVYESLGQYQKAIEFHQQSLAIAKQIGDRSGEARSLGNLGNAYNSLGQYQKAIEFFQQSLVFAKQIGDRSIEANSLNNLGNVYESLGQYQKAIEFHQQSLAIAKQIGDRSGEARSLGNLGNAYNSLGQYQKAIEFFQQSLVFAKQIGNRSIEVASLANLGKAYYSLGQYQKAIEFSQQSLVIAKQIGDRSGESKSLGNLGNVYESLGQYQKAIEFHQQSLAIAKQIGDRQWEAGTLDNLGLAYNSLGQYQKAIEFFQQSLVFAKQIGDRSAEVVSLANLGAAYGDLGQHQKAIEFFQQSLLIARQIGDRSGEAKSLGNLGVAYYSLGQYQKAIKFYQKWLAIAKQIGDRENEGISLSKLGTLLAKQKQPELAIVFYKQSVNVREGIRHDIRGLDKELRQSYTNTVAGTYRRLADLLLAQGRILEAQQVLELLKVEEIRTFTRNRDAGGKNDGIATNPSETKVLNSHSSLIALGMQVDKCERSKCAQIGQLKDRREVLTQEFNATVRALEKEIRSRLAKDDAFFDPRKIQAKAEAIVSAQPGTVLIYPLVLKDKVWILWAAKGGITKSIEVPNTGQEQLGKLVLELRGELNQTGSPEDLVDLKATSKKIYDVLIPPSLRAELKANNIQNLVFSLDSVTRYIPMAVLHDGEQFLIEKYAISTVVSADLTDTSDRLPTGSQNTSVLAAGLSQPVPGFSALPNVPAELNAIVRSSASDTKGIFNGTKLLNQAFNRKALRDHISGHRILHIATHGKFEPGSADASYLMLGDGNKLPIPEIPTALQDLTKVHLVVLSACETALGTAAQDGTEIAGISYYFLNGGAKAVIASLWAVDDASTRLLMEEFYANLAKSTPQVPISKAAAMRQAQLSLLHRKTKSDSTNFSYPHYWAPFILIGNAL